MSDKNETPLPPGWDKIYSNSQKRYYYSHTATKHTQWHFPTASEAADPWMAKRRAEENAVREKEKMRQGGGDKRKLSQDLSTNKPSYSTPEYGTIASAFGNSLSHILNALSGAVSGSILDIALYL